MPMDPPFKPMDPPLHGHGPPLHAHGTPLHAPHDGAPLMFPMDPPPLHDVLLCPGRCAVKHQLEVEEKKKKAMDKHLGFLLGQNRKGAVLDGIVLYCTCTSSRTALSWHQ